MLKEKSQRQINNSDKSVISIIIFVAIFTLMSGVYLCTVHRCSAMSVWEWADRSCGATVPLPGLGPLSTCRTSKEAALQHPCKKKRKRSILEKGFIGDRRILPPIRAQILRWRHTFFTSFSNLDWLSHSSELTWGRKCKKKKKKWGERRRRGLRLLVLWRNYPWWTN